eukprot:CAMPEP_0201574310 /NCGR_PEP_ID=MMETSP0190_2-20130828/18740_1 /ASSEMBLY_ACC=CAM_ASM_000263 /TAXON_ID=37353 /ORGANISM="Rosalina sp." /LENGTH=847 /DNA_ID=CAMNT_0048002389 /DNA_START=21 /DNA_END=2567 /DNA_ORIENTATION=+
MANNRAGGGKALQAGYGNGGLSPMAQFEKLGDKITNSLKNLEYTRDMLKKLAESERNSAKSIATILNQKNKTLRFSVVDQAIQNYWKKQESFRRHFSTALLEKIIGELDTYINSGRDRKKKLSKENKKVQATFIECKKEATKQKALALKEWTKLEEQITKNESYKKQNKQNKVKDLKSLQEKCSKTFAKYESYVAKLNELEQANHQQACKIGELLHESQTFASARLAMHYNMAVSSKKYLDEFVTSNKSIVQSKAPPLTDILWRWLTYPKNHQTHSLPCTSKEVYQKQSIGQGFKRRVEPDYQQSQFLKPPKKQAKSPRQPSKRKQPPKQQGQQQQSSQPQRQKKKDKKGKKVKKPKNKQQSQSQPKPQQQQSAPPPADEGWDVDFGDDNAFGGGGGGDNNAASNGSIDAFPSGGNAMSDEDFFGASGGFDDSKANATEPKPADKSAGNGQASFGFGDDDNNGASFGFENGDADIFGAVQDVKQPKIEEKEAPKQKDLVEQHKEEMNGFTAGFDDGFAVDFGDNNQDLQIANDNAGGNSGGGGGGGFGDDNWDTSFGDDAFAKTDNTTANKPEEDVDQLFAASAAQDIFAGDSNNAPSANTTNTNANNGPDPFLSGGGGFGDDLFGNSNDNKQTDKPPPPANVDNDNMGDFDFDAMNNAIEPMSGLDNDININSDNGGGDDIVFDVDDEFDAPATIEFPEFDVNAATPGGPSSTTKKRKSKLKKKKKETKTLEPVIQAYQPQASPQPNEITSIPEPVISFDAPDDDESKLNTKQSEDDDDNPFGVDDPFGGSGDDDNIGGDDGDMDIDADNPFAMFDEPDDTANNGNTNTQTNATNDANDFDPFGGL